MRTILLPILLTSVTASAFAQQPTADAPAAPAVQTPAVQSVTTVPPVPAALPLAGPTGMVFHAIKADRTAEFEAVMSRLHDLLAASGNDVRRQQGRGWRVYRQATPLPDGAVLYVSFLDPVVANAEYDVPRLLAEAAPDEALALYEQFRDAHVQPAVQASNLTLTIPAPVATPASVQP